VRTRFKRFVSGLGVVALAVLLVAVATGAFGGERIEPGRVQAPPGEPPPARTAQAERGEVEVLEPAIGTVRSRRNVTVAAQVGATIVSVEVEAGQAVEAGAPAVALDDRDLSARLTQARQGLAAAEAAVKSAEEGKAQGEAQLEQARSAYERVQGFYEAGAATSEQLEAAQAAFLSARAAVAGAEAQIAVALASREQAQAALTSAGVALEHASVTVPMDGVVAERAVEAGDLAWPGRTLFTVLDPGALRLEARVREGLIARIQPGDELEIELPGAGLRLPGRVAEVLPAADARSRTFEVRVEFDAPQGVLPGMFGRLRIPVGTREVVRVPAGAIVRVGQLEMVRVVEDGRSERRLVTTGMGFDDGSVEVLSGLEGGETVGLPEER
jgi:RND family efflux transporter MFP subunit